MIKRYQAMVLATMLAVTVAGCGGCSSTLEQGGVYAPGVTATVTNSDNTISQVFTPTQRPDMELFVADTTFAVGYSGMNAVFELEKANRAWLFRQSPQIKRALDEIRPQATDAVRRYSDARKAYIGNPTPAGLSALQTALAEAQRVSTAVQTVLPTKK